MIDLHYWPTNNGIKVAILLEELGIPYRIVPVNLGRGDQFADDFLAISPNNRMPAIVDTEPKGGGAPLSVFESGAILFYLAEKEGRFWPQDDARVRYEVVQWVVWQAANQGPKFGERGHFAQVPESAGDQSYARRRFDDEVHRLYGVLNNRLHDRRHVAGDDYTIADIAAYPYTMGWRQQGIDLDEFRYVKRWFDEVSARPAVQRGLALTAGPPEDPAKLSPEEAERRRGILFNQRARPAP
ncbi:MULTISPECIES: glutathione S-transferase N-terminal domain-containing protein [unclassified Sphingomonas]|uniref:glutathione S-transferase N-terminal domain-containing protein n=1 Tax=unclassified Sphingomonas TaxID=196159 RepID=UPI0006FB9C17|nr:MULTISPECIES: glutathione S-transferase N-terminal domain-containing protein [unclassified Sphingomonas]KQX19635.1 glutathione S-transferase [Sphingomonas sp. Root1294]KQY65836.1 glutathione S-transferase [Sphingomonas sp. Root50]KRB94857.1 glutathione S-transferase [Sphingomonas sp. Root720]